MLNNLPDSYLKHLVNREPREVTPSIASTIKARLEPFSLDGLVDKSESANLPIPAGFGSVNEELELCYQTYDDSWEAMASLVNAEHPEIPKTFNTPVGWSVYQGGKWHRIKKLPEGRAFVLDFETVEVSEGIWHPICAVAMSAAGWLVWRSGFTDIFITSTVPFTGGHNILGYNVSYDRSYLDIEYLQKPSGNTFYDLMSMWIVTNGMSNQQRTVFAKCENSSTEDSGYDLSAPAWVKRTGTNGLASAYKFYTGKTLDKGVVDGIVNGGLLWVQQNMTDVIRYCMHDVLATHELGSYLFHAYAAARPSKINRYGSLDLGSCWVPLDRSRYPGYQSRNEALYQKEKSQLNGQLLQACTDYLENHTEEPESLDWTLAKTGKNRGLPQWYRDVLAAHAKGKLSLTQRFAPVVLGMTWRSEPLVWDKNAYGWATKKHGLVPHPTDRGQPVKSMFLKDFSELHENGTISAPDYVSDLVKSRVSLINWVSFRKRAAAMRTSAPEGFPVHIPVLVPNGTITGRAKDSLIHVASNPKKTRVGTEFKSLIAPPEGYVFIGADVDSEEAWLAGLHGDQHLGFNASTPLGAMNAMGNSKDGTDIHSVVAKRAKVPRDIAKNRVYGGLYGQGVKGDSDILLRADPTLSEADAKVASIGFMAFFKGTKNYESHSYSGGLASHSFTQMEKLAEQWQPKTPLTGAFMSKALAGVSDYKPTRVNWVVQSSGVDFRDMLVIMTKWFYQRFGVDGRLVITIHDEIRTCVKASDTTKAIYALQLAHLYTRAAFIRAHDLDNIPAGVAWFSNVDVDATCLRKNPLDPQVTPLQSALPLGYTVNAQQLLDLLNAN